MSTAYQLFQLPFQANIDSSVRVVPCAKALFYATGTTTPQDTYADAGLATPNANPVVADANGVLAPIYLNPALIYKLTLTTSADVLIRTVDPVNDQILSQLIIGQFLYPRTAAEIAAGVTPTLYFYPPGDVRRYGAVGDGITDDSFAFQQALSVAQFYEVVIFYTASGYIIGTPLVAPDNCAIRGINKPQLKAVTNGQDILSSSSNSTFAIRGVRFIGTSASTVPSNGYGASASNTGLLTCSSCTDVLIEDCEFDQFYNGVTAQSCTRVWIERNRVIRFYFVGIICSQTNQFTIERNIVTNCQQSGSAIAYGITGTGDEDGGDAQQVNSISFNQINGVPSWDGIMSHDVTGITIIGNDIRDVRRGIDFGHFLSTNVINDIVISGNIIQSTTTDTWSGAAADCGGITVVGYDATNHISNVTITGNVVREFFNMVGMTGGGFPSNVVIANADHVTIGDNVVSSAAGAFNNAGIYVLGAVNSLTITGNSLQGVMALGAIRFAGVTSDICSITGNTMLQNNPGSDSGLTITGSTLSAFSQSGNVTNSTLPFFASTSTIIYKGPSSYRVVINQAVASLSAGAQRQDAFALPGIQAGDSVSVTLPPIWTAGLIATPPIIGTGQAFLQLYNPTGGALSMVATNFTFNITLYR